MIHLSRLLRWNFLFIAAVVCCVRVKLVEGGDDNGLGIQYDWKKSVSADEAQTSDKPVMVIIHRAGCPGILIAHRGFFPTVYCRFTVFSGHNILAKSYISAKYDFEIFPRTPLQST